MNILCLFFRRLESSSVWTICEMSSGVDQITHPKFTQIPAPWQVECNLSQCFAHAEHPSDVSISSGERKNATLRSQISNLENVKNLVSSPSPVDDVVSLDIFPQSFVFSLSSLVRLSLAEREKSVFHEFFTRPSLSDIESMKIISAHFFSCLSLARTFREECDLIIIVESPTELARLGTAQCVTRRKSAEKKISRWMWNILSWLLKCHSETVFFSTHFVRLRLKDKTKRVVSSTARTQISRETVVDSRRSWIALFLIFLISHNY